MSTQKKEVERILQKDSLSDEDVDILVQELLNILDEVEAHWNNLIASVV